MCLFDCFPQSAYAESKYGAFAFDGTVLGDPQPDDVIAYTLLQNTTSYHATAVFANVRALPP